MKWNEQEGEEDTRGRVKMGGGGGRTEKTGETGGEDNWVSGEVFEEHQAGSKGERRN